MTSAASVALSPAEQHRAVDLAREAITNPKAAQQLAARLVALEAVFRDAKRNRYLMRAPTVRPMIDRATALMEES